MYLQNCFQLAFDISIQHSVGYSLVQPELAAARNIGVVEHSVQTRACQLGIATILGVLLLHHSSHGVNGSTVLRGIQLGKVGSGWM